MLKMKRKKTERRGAKEIKPETGTTIQDKAKKRKAQTNQSLMEEMYYPKSGDEKTETKNAGDANKKLT